MKNGILLALMATPLAAQEVWTTAHVAPMSSSYVAMCWHDADHRLVAVAPRWDGDTLETWERVGGVWQQRDPVTRPPAWDGARIVYDSARRVVVMFGGATIGIGFSNETWEWDGVDWTQRTPAHAPSPRIASMVYDPVREVTLVYGGFGDGAGFFDDVWQWDGVDWTRLADAPPPLGARAGALMAFDEGRGVTVVFGGNTSMANNDVFEFDGTTWSRFEPTQRPPAFRDAALAYDPTSGQVLLHGGKLGLVPNHDVWAWDGRDWTQRVAPPVHAGDRLAAAFVFAEDSRRLVVHGGDPLQTDTWSYDSEANSWHRDAYEAAGTSLFAPSCFDGVSHTLLVTADDTWLWDHATRAFERAPVGPRPPYTTAVMAFDSIRNQAVWFGAVNGQQQTWTLDRATMQWQQANPTSMPPFRESPAMAFDPATATVLMFGGVDTITGTTHADTWSWNGTDWTQLAPAASPSARHAASMAFDPHTGHVVLFGGAAPTILYDDVWQWDGVDWSQRQIPVAGPGARRDALLGGRSDGLLLAGGSDATSLLGDLWLLRNDVWVQLAAEGMPATLYPQGTVDAVTGELVVFGGLVHPEFSVGQTIHGVWTWGLPPSRVTTVGRGCAGSNGVPELSIAPSPTPGQSSLLTTAHAVAGSVVAFAFGDTAQRIDLPGGCRVLVAPPYVPFAATVQPTGVADLALPVPSNAALLGTELWTQAVALDPAIGYALSNALRLRVGTP